MGRTRSLREIAEGAGVHLEWLKSVCYGTIQDPGVTRLEKLLRYLEDLEAARRVRQTNSKARTRA
jgi:hypothetical protein